jgi:hypothetical protein
MIENARTQKAKNFEMLYLLSDALKNLHQVVLARQRVGSKFIATWNNIMGWAPKVFEDHPLLDILRKIDTEIKSSQ